MERRVSLAVIGALGGGTKQAVSQSGDPKRWLDASVRRTLVQPGTWWKRAWGVPKATVARAKEMVYAVDRRLKALPAPKSGGSKGGRPVERSSAALALLLELEPKEGERLLMTFARYLHSCLWRLVRSMRGHAGMRWFRLSQRLDDCLPRWPHRAVGRPPPSWDAYRRAVAESRAC